MKNDQPAKRPLVFIHRDLDDRTDITPNALRVYVHLIRRANGSGTAWPSYQTVGDHCFASVSDNKSTRKSFARNAINELIDHGLISKNIRRKEDGALTSNAYRIIDGYGAESDVSPEVDPVPNSIPMPSLADPMLNKQTLCLSSTEVDPIEVDPNEERERARAPDPLKAPVVTLNSPYMPKGMHLPRGYMPAGTGENAVQVYYERFSPAKPEERLSAPQEDDLHRLCPDLNRLREVITAYANAGFKNPRNVQLILDWYRTGIPNKHRRNSRGTYQQNGIGNDRREPSGRASGDKPADVEPYTAEEIEQIRRFRRPAPKPVPAPAGAIAYA